MRPFMKLMTMVVFTCFFFEGIAQNTCQTAQGLGYPGEPFSINGSTANANDNATSGATFCTVSVGTGGQVWYAMYWGEDHVQTVTMTTEGGITNFDTKLHVYTGYCGSFTCLAGDDDSGAGTTSLVQFTVYPGNYYFIRVGGFNALTGNFTLSVDAGVGGCTDYAASNYNPSATWNDGTCCYGIPAQMYFGNNGQDYFAEMELYIDGVLVDYMSAGVQHDICIESGCYISIACQSDNACNSWEGNTYNITINGVNYSGVIPEPVNGSDTSSIDLGYVGCGCTDPSAINYKPGAYEDDGSCQYPQVNGLCENAITINPNLGYLVQNSGQQMVQANWPECGMNWQFPGVWYEFVYEGGTILLLTSKIVPCDPVLGLYDACGGELIACNDDASGNEARLFLNCSSGLIAGNTYYLLAGAWGSGAEFFLNFQQLDTPGCTDPLAVNFNACASVDDESCAYGVQSCDGDLDYNGSINVADLLIFLTLYNTTCNP